MAEFTLPSLFAIALFIKYAQYCFRVHPEWHFLHLYRLEKLGCFPLRLFVRGLFFLFLGFLGGFSLLFWGLGLRCLGLDLLYVFLGLGTFFLCFGLYQSDEKPIRDLNETSPGRGHFAIFAAYILHTKCLDGNISIARGRIEAGMIPTLSTATLDEGAFCFLSSFLGGILIERAGLR